MICFVSRFIKLKNKDFFFVPLSFEDELLSSWLCRVSYKHFTTPNAFLNMHFSEYGSNILTRRDIDIWAKKELLNKIQKKSFLNEQRIFNLTLRSYESYLNEVISSKRQNNLILPLGNLSDTKYSYGLKFCPLCLKEKAYFQKKWRLSFYNICTKHHVFLQNCCPKCLSSLNITRMYKNNLKFTHCYKCGFILRKSSFEEASNEDMIISRELLKYLNKGYVEINLKPTYSIFYFSVLKHLTFQILHYWKNGIMLEVEYFDKNPYNKKRNARLEQDFSIKELHFAFKIAYLNISNIYFYKNILLKKGTYKSDFTKDMHYVPFWYKELINSL